MKIPNWRGWSKADAPSVDEDIARGMESISRQLVEITKALQGRLGPENFNWEIRELEFEDGIAQTVELQRLSSRASAAWLLQSGLAGGVLYWSPGKTGKEISVAVTWPSPGPSTRVGVKFLVMGQ
jgi:hypothetical protein